MCDVCMPKVLTKTPSEYLPVPVIRLKYERIIEHILYVTTPEAYLFKDGENVVIRVKEKDIFRIRF